MDNNSTEPEQKPQPQAQPQPSHQAQTEPSPWDSGSTAQQTTAEGKPWGMDVKTFNVFMHLSQFAGVLVPFAGIVLPIVMWLTNKEHEAIDQHGKAVVNWLISFGIYFTVSIVLAIVLVGFLLVPILLLLNFIFVIVGAVKASNEEVWQYPMSIKFFK